MTEETSVREAVLIATFGHIHCKMNALKNNLHKISIILFTMDMWEKKEREKSCEIVFG